MTVGRNRICVRLGRDATVLEVAMPWLHLQQSWLRCDSLEFERRQGATRTRTLGQCAGLATCQTRTHIRRMFALLLRYSAGGTTLESDTHTGSGRVAIMIGGAYQTETESDTRPNPTLTPRLPSMRPGTPAEVTVHYSTGHGHGGFTVGQTRCEGRVLLDVFGLEEATIPN